MLSLEKESNANKCSFNCTVHATFSDYGENRPSELCHGKKQCYEEAQEDEPDVHIYCSPHLI